MFYLGYSGFGESVINERAYLGRKYDELELSNMIVDEVKITEDLSKEPNIEKTGWDSTDVVFDAKFKNDLEAGNIDNEGIPIQKIRISRQKYNSLIWEIMAEVDYDKDIINYDLMDYFVENGVEYNYKIEPVTQGITGVGNSKSITASYDYLFMTDSYNNIPFRFDLEMGDITVVTDQTEVTTLSSRYPALLGGKLKHLKGSFTCTIISKGTEENYGEINIQEENEYNKKIEDFLTNGKPKLLRYHSRYLLVNTSTSGSITRSVFNHKTAFGIWKIKCDYTECGDTDLETLKKNGIEYILNIGE